MINIEFARGKIKPCVYYKVTDKAIVTCVLYVDNCIIFFNNEADKKKIRKILFKKFNMRDLGKLREFLGMRVTRDKQKMLIS